MLRERVYISPDSGKPLSLSADGEALLSGDGERFPIGGGIAYLLPKHLENDVVKNREKEGWSVLVRRHNWLVTAEGIMALPAAGNDAYWGKVRDTLPMIDAALGSLAGKLGLDLACGIGWATAYFAQRGARMIAADFNDTPQNGLGSAVLTRQKGLEFDAVCCDGENLPIADNSLDFAFICSALHHFTRPGATLKEVFRCLKPGGVFLDICESYRTGIDDHQRESSYEQLVEFREAGINELSYRESEYRALFEQAGFAYSVYMPGWDHPDGPPSKAWENGEAGRAREGRPGWKQAIIRAAAATPLIGIVRDQKLHRTVSNRVIVARKP